MKNFAAKKSRVLFYAVTVFHFCTFINAFHGKQFVPPAIFFLFFYFCRRHINYFSGRCNYPCFYIAYFCIVVNRQVDFIKHFNANIIFHFYKPIHIIVLYQIFAFKLIIKNTVVHQIHGTGVFQGIGHFVQHWFFGPGRGGIVQSIYLCIGTQQTKKYSNGGEANSFIHILFYFFYDFIFMISK